MWVWISRLKQCYSPLQLKTGPVRLRPHAVAVVNTVCQHSVTQQDFIASEPQRKPENEILQTHNDNMKNPQEEKLHGGDTGSFLLAMIATHHPDMIKRVWTTSMGPPTADVVSPSREALPPPCRQGIEGERIQAMKQALLGVSDES